MLQFFPTRLLHSFIPLCGRGRCFSSIKSSDEYESGAKHTAIDADNQSNLDEAAEDVLEDIDSSHYSQLATSDAENVIQRWRDPNRRPLTGGWNQFATQSPDIDPLTTSILLFPGQGSSFVGMGQQLAGHRGAQRLFEIASEMLRTDLLKLCLQGPEEKLAKTIHSQPAIYVCSMAAVQMLRDEKPKMVERCVATAGFSVGEISALAFAGAMTFEEGLHLVRVRSEGMQRACEMADSGMMSVFLGPNSQLAKACTAAREYCKTKLDLPHPICQIANHLSFGCKVIAGHNEALDFVATYADEFHLRRPKRLPVSGAFHTPLMGPAMVPVRNALSRMATLRCPEIPVVSNLDSRPHTGVISLTRKLTRQIVRPCRWEQCLHALYTRPEEAAFPQTYEVGPGQQLGIMLKSVNLRAYQNYHSVDV